MADAWSSSTSYYAGRRDGDWDESAAPSHVNGADAANGAYAPRAIAPVREHGGYNGRSAVAPSPYNGAARYPRSATATAGAPLTRAQERRQLRQRGLAGWLALLVMLAIAGVGGVIDLISGSNVRGGFNIGLVIASIVAILVVRHRDMFPIVVAPPIVYVVAYGVMLYIRSGGLHNRKILTDSAANLLVYGFPAIAGASAAVLIIAGIRLVLGK